MRTIVFAVFVLALGFAFTAITMSGVGATIFGMESGDNTGLGPMNALNDSANESGTVDGDVGTNDGDSNIIGFVINSSQFIVNVGKTIVTLPAVLHSLGLPWFFAYPAGLFMQVVSGIGVMQFATGRDWR